MPLVTDGAKCFLDNANKWIIFILNIVLTLFSDARKKDFSDKNKSKLLEYIRSLFALPVFKTNTEKNHTGTKTKAAQSKTSPFTSIFLQKNYLTVAIKTVCQFWKA